MDIMQGIMLGILQGATEFLPVSSSGHLVLGQLCLGIREPMLFFDISVHMGTLLAVCLVYYNDIRNILRSLIDFPFRWFRGEKISLIFQSDPCLSLACWILLSCIPTAMLGFFLKGFEEYLFSSYLVVGSMLIITGILLRYSVRFYDQAAMADLNAKRSVLLGIAQGFAVLPGISRSGTTIVTGMALGLPRDQAARFSFLMSVPAIVGAQLLGIKDLIEKDMSIDPAVIFGTLSAFFTGLVALKVLLALVQRGKLHVFAIYCWFLGAVTLVIGSMGSL